MNDILKLPQIKFNFQFSFMGENNQTNVIKYFEIIERIIGHIAWPIVVLLIFLYFKKELLDIIRRIKTAEFKDFRVELVDKLGDVRSTAIHNSVTMYYPIDIINREFNPELNKTKESQILDAWKEIEHLIFELDENTESRNIIKSLNTLKKEKKIQTYLVEIIFDLRELRNIVVHQHNPVINEDDFQNWISISKSVIDRLKKQLQ